MVIVKNQTELSKKTWIGTINRKNSFKVEGSVLYVRRLKIDVNKE